MYTEEYRLEENIGENPWKGRGKVFLNYQVLCDYSLGSDKGESIYCVQKSNYSSQNFPHLEARKQIFGELRVSNLAIFKEKAYLSRLKA